jgi:hypothetical protein
MRARFERKNIFATKLSIVGAALYFGVLIYAREVAAQTAVDGVANSAWQAGAIKNSQLMRAFPDSDHGVQPTPNVIPKFEVDFDALGLIATYQPGGATKTSTNPFFQNLGTNQRTCFTCHQPQTGWTVSAQSVQARFYASFASDPIFRLVDGATCPSDDVSSLSAKLTAYRLLMSKGLIRVGVPMPAPPVSLEFQVVNVADPYNCNTNPTTGLTSPTTGIVSIYRRPLPSTNLGFLSTIMWDGREPSLASQAVDATRIHAQGVVVPSRAQQQQIVDFETGISTAQLFSNVVGYLNAAGATGGPVALQQELAGFYIGINDPLGLNPKGIPFTPLIFDTYKAWENRLGSSGLSAKHASVARGEQLFNNTSIKITNVNGLNDALNQPTISGFCGTCHDTPSVGDHSVKAPLNIGVANAGQNSPPDLDISGLPVFTLQCMSGALSGQRFVVTDVGRALISGKCADIGKVKGPILRGLAGRAPYFHNGSAATLLDAVNFYNDRFNIGFTDQQKQDLVAFLETL